MRARDLALGACVGLAGACGADDTIGETSTTSTGGATSSTVATGGSDGGGGSTQGGAGGAGGDTGGSGGEGTGGAASGMTAALQSGSFFVNCQPIVSPDPISGGFVAVYDNTAGTGSGSATITNAYLEIAAPNQNALVWTFAATPPTSGLVPPGQTAQIGHDKVTATGMGESGPCGYCNGTWSLHLSWDVGGVAFSDTLNLGSVECAF